MVRFWKTFYNSWTYICCTLMLVGLISILTFIITGSKIDKETGFLVEPFALIPIGYILILLGFIGVIVKAIIILWQKYKKQTTST